MSQPPATSVPTLWQIYKSRFIYTQLFILAGCAFIWWYRGNRYLAITTFCLLQLVAVYGAWMSRRMLEAIHAQTHGNDDLKHS